MLRIKSIGSLKAKATAKGIAARKRGLPQTCNPYRRDDIQARFFEAWLRGWLQQRKAELTHAA